MISLSPHKVRVETKDTRVLTVTGSPSLSPPLSPPLFLLSRFVIVDVETLDHFPCVPKYNDNFKTTYCKKFYFSSLFVFTRLLDHPSGVYFCADVSGNGLNRLLLCPPGHVTLKSTRASVEIICTQGL